MNGIRKIIIGGIQIDFWERKYSWGWCSYNVDHTVVQPIIESYLNREGFLDKLAARRKKTSSDRIQKSQQRLTEDMQKIYQGNNEGEEWKCEND